jgi:3-oxoacyl-[acyl-carrier-protein] synthase II
VTARFASLITGDAALTPLGRFSSESGLPAGCAIAPVQRFDARGFPVTVAAECAPRDAEVDQVALGLAAVRAALGDGEAIARLVRAHGAERIGVFFGAEPERVTLDDWTRVVEAGEAAALGEGAYRRRSPSRITDAVAELVGARGPRRTFAMACVSSAAAIAAAHRALAAGEVTCAIAGGAALNVEPLLFAGFCLLGAMSRAGACRPFDAARDGFVLGDGAACLILEEERAARRAGRSARGRILGAGQSQDAWRMTDPAPDGRGARAAIASALDEAGAGAGEIALVKAHATGTPKNDAVEAQVIFDLFGDRVPVAAWKGALGHSIAASGAVEAIAALGALRARAVGGAPSLRTVDGELPPIDVVPDGAPPRPLAGDLALCDTFGFGGLNCALVVGLP